MKTNLQKQPTRLIPLCVVGLLVASAASSRSATKITWTGGGGDGYWSTAANWNPNTVIGVNTSAVLQFDGINGLVNTNDVAGDTNAGIVFLPTAGAFTLNPGAGGTTLLGGNVVNQSTNVQTINQNLQITAGNRSILAYAGFNNVGDILLNGVISDDGGGRSLTFAASSLPAAFQPGQGEGNDGGDVTLTAANTYSGTTFLGSRNSGNGAATLFPKSAINGTGFGTLTLNYATASAPANNILYNGIASPGLLELDNGSTLLIEGAPGAGNANAFGNLEYAIGLNTVQLDAGTGGTVTASFGNLTVPDQNNNSRAGAINFILGPNTQVLTTSANNPTTGILNNSAWAGANYLVNGSDWACSSNGIIVACTNYQADAVGTANANLDVVTSGNDLSANVATIHFNQNASLVLSNTIGTTLANYAILMSPNVGANTNVITGAGTLSVPLARALLVYNFDTNSNGRLVIDCPIGSSGGAQTTFMGPGLTVLTQTNQAGSAGVFSIMGGARLLINQNACLGNPADGYFLQMDGGTLLVQTNLALDNNNGGGLNARNIALGTHGGAFDVSGTNTLIVSGVITNGTGGPLTKEGMGTLELTAVNEYNGPTFVQGGTLLISQAPNGTGPIVVNDDATLIDSGSVSIKPASLMLGSSTGCTNTFTGVNSTAAAPIRTTTLDANGTITINVSGNLNTGVYPLISYSTNVGTGNFVVGTLPLGVAGDIITNNSTNIALNVTSSATPDVWRGNVNGNWDIATTTNWTFNAVPSVYHDGDAVQFDDSASTFNVNVAANVSPASVKVANSQNPYVFSGTNVIGGSGGLLKTGTNSLTIAATISTGGGITVNAGTMVVGDGSSNGVVTVPIVDNASVVFDRSDTNGIFTAGITGTGSVTIDAQTNGLFAMSGINAYSGNTIVQSGTLQAIGASSIPGVAGGGVLIVNHTGVLNVNGSPLTVNGLSGNGVVDNQATPEVTFTVGANNTTSTFAGTLTNRAGLLDLVKIGNGTLYLTGTNYNAGVYEFNAGIVNAASFSDYSDAGTPNAGPSAIGQRASSQETSGAADTSIGLFFQGGTLQYTGSTPQETDRQIRLKAGTVSTIDASGSNPNATLYWSYGDTIGGNIDLFSTPGTRTLQLAGSNTGTNTFDIQITDQAAHATSVNKNGPGTWYMLGGAFAGPNEYSGPTTISGGTLVISTTHNDSGGLPASANGLGPFTVHDGATLGVTDGGNFEPALMGDLTVGSSSGGNMEFLNIPVSGVPMIEATKTVFHGNCTIICATNNLTAGTVYPLLTYGTLSGSYALSPMPGPLYYSLTNDGVNLDLVASSTPIVSTTPTSITALVAGGQLMLSWPADHTGWRLQAQTNSLGTGIGTNWFDISGSTTTNQVVAPINPTNGCVFYRLVYP